jgi:hypothetical protein
MVAGQAEDWGHKLGRWNGEELDASQTRMRIHLGEAFLL